MDLINKQHSRYKCSSSFLTPFCYSVINLVTDLLSDFSRVASKEGKKSLLTAIDHIDFMWLDMQGFELNALKNSQIAFNTTLIYCEVEFIEFYEGQYLYHDVKEWLEANGFEIIAVDFDAAAAEVGDFGGHSYGNILFKKTL